jgi:hypothetical protein
MAKRLAGKMCLITGAASGIGAASTFLFAEKGATVIVALRVAFGSIVAKRWPRPRHFSHFFGLMNLFAVGPPSRASV